MYGYKCQYCGAYLDPGEKCDCVLENEKAAELKAQSGKTVEKQTRHKNRCCVMLNQEEGCKYEIWRKE